MRIFIITQEDSFYLPLVLQKIIVERQKDIIGISILRANTTFFSTVKEHFEIYDLRTFLYQSCRFLYYKLMDILTPVIRPKRFYSMKAVAINYHVPLYETENINSSAFRKVLRDLNLDVIISINSSQIFRNKLLAIPKRGCINVHGALLPKYRGRLPSFWVLANDEKETGVTVHHMNEHLDDGPIIIQEKVKIEPTDTQHTLLLKTKRLGAELLLKALNQIESGTVETSPNNRNEATCYLFPRKEDAKRFRSLGRRFI